jgi:hypothetical protein
VLLCSLLIYYYKGYMLQDAHPKGEIFLGHVLDGYNIRIGVPPGTRDQGFAFTLRTPERSYNLSAASDEDREEWIQAIDSVLERPLTPQDTSSK